MNFDAITTTYDRKSWLLDRMFKLFGDLMKDTANSHFKMKCVHEINVFFDDLLTVLSQEAGFYSFFPSFSFLNTCCCFFLIQYNNSLSSKPLS